MCLLIDNMCHRKRNDYKIDMAIDTNMCHRKRNDYKIDMAIDTFWHESIVHKIGKVLFIYNRF